MPTESLTGRPVFDIVGGTSSFSLFSFSTRVWDFHPSPTNLVLKVHTFRTTYFFTYIQGPPLRNP